MSQVIQYRCDICGGLSGTTNGWRLVRRNRDLNTAIIQPIEHVKLVAVRQENSPEPIVLDKWDSLDICGSQCLCKAISNGQSR